LPGFQPFEPLVGRLHRQRHLLRQPLGVLGCLRRGPALARAALVVAGELGASVSVRRADHHMIARDARRPLDLGARGVRNRSRHADHVQHHQRHAFVSRLHDQRLAVQGVQDAVGPSLVVVARHGNAQGRRDVQRGDAGAKTGGSSIRRRQHQAGGESESKGGSHDGAGSGERCRLE